jgi:hypothetical protein
MADWVHAYNQILTKNQGWGAGIETGRNRIHLGSPEPEPYSEYGSGSEYKKMKQTTKKKNSTKILTLQRREQESAPFELKFNKSSALFKNFLLLAILLSRTIKKIPCVMSIHFSHIWKCTVKNIFLNNTLLFSLAS